MKLRKLIIVMSVVSAFSAHATDSSLNEYSLVKDGISYTLSPDSSNGTSITIDDTTVYVGVTSWADTGYYYGTFDKWSGGYYGGKYYQAENDDLVVNQGSLNDYGAGYGLVNNDVISNQKGDQHSIDNYDAEKGIADFDMVLLSFSTDVTLTDASFSWVKDYDNTNSNKEVTVVGLDDVSLFSSGQDFTWADVAETTISSAVGHYGVSNTKVGNSFVSEFTNLTSAQYWLVGAYNTFFDNSTTSNNFGFKLSSLGIELASEETTPPTQVSEPGALALMSLGLGLVLYRRKRRV
ncbi:exosortase-dependent surface protein XDP1 [Alteromonas mediterranea]|uniref:exosortase-dependent surface protein XDP1 n=1 Tax=Alteromonas mediterranea TaxID=314275 RepID=UPI0012FC637A|nr:exosortase-dependent surface protein XDP1 [Alteromonas mediterranea]QGX62413.1 PEP-CTERM sorting domain-containing protein [Alteromonas mediterranea]